jgi:hypothetical protein
MDEAFIQLGDEFSRIDCDQYPAEVQGLSLRFGMRAVTPADRASIRLETATGDVIFTQPVLLNALVEGRTVSNVTLGVRFPAPGRYAIVMRIGERDVCETHFSARLKVSGDRQS